MEKINTEEIKILRPYSFKYIGVDNNDFVMLSDNDITTTYSLLKSHCEETLDVWVSKYEQILIKISIHDTGKYLTINIGKSSTDEICIVCYPSSKTSPARYKFYYEHILEKIDSLYYPPPDINNSIFMRQDNNLIIRSGNGLYDLQIIDGKIITSNHFVYSPAKNIFYYHK